MNASNLSFTGLPPIDVPFRYFITAPLFVIAIAILIFNGGEQLWISRWQAETLAITHAFTLGFIASVMMGALFQLLPVTAGISIGKPRIVASFCHVLHTVGSILLIIGFLTNKRETQLSAGITLGVGFALYIIIFGYYLLKNQLTTKNNSHNFTLSGIKLALLALLFTVSLGLLLQSKIMGLNIIAWNKAFTDLHATWGLTGWIGILIMSISFQVIPMFHVAPNFPFWLKRFLPIAIILCLIALTLVKFVPALLVLKPVIQWILLLLNGIYCVYLLRILHQRKRKIPDTSVNYWRFASIGLLLSALLYIIPENLLPLYLLQKLPILLTTLFIFIFVVSVLQGMLLKILPFLAFTHLQQKCMTNFAAMQFLPNMHKLLSSNHARTLFILHCLTSFTLIISILNAALYWIFALLLFIEFSWLTFLIIKVFCSYQLVNKKINAMATSVSIQQ